jgi:quercetin dioxygenase-like cupin family protein
MRRLDLLHLMGGPKGDEMIRTEETIHRTLRDTDGEYELRETILRPGEGSAALHCHPYQSETVVVLAGRVGIQVGAETFELAAGDGLTVLPRTSHAFWNAGDGEARLSRAVRPAEAGEAAQDGELGRPD